MESSIPLPARTFGNGQTGPHLLITAGVHGDEYLPMLAVSELIRRFESDPELAAALKGTLSLIPLVNEPAFRRGHRTGDDGLDLARTCPGDSQGSATERIAHALSEQIRQADCYIDLHTGGTELCVWPLAGYNLHPDKDKLETQRGMARAFGLPFIWGTSAELEGRSLSVARDAGVPAIYIEYLGAHRELQEVAEGFLKKEGDHPVVRGCFNVMRHLDMLPEVPMNFDEPEIIEDPRPQSGHMQVCHPAPITGFFEPGVKLGQIVHRGELLCTIISVTGDTRETVVSDTSGRVIVLRDYPRINQSDATAVVVEIPSSAT